jgi:hypothetical protein
MMISRVYRTINSKNKANIRFVALGSFQIEFFEIETRKYFGVYRYTTDSMRNMLVDFGAASVSKLESGFQIIEGKHSYKISIKETDNKTKMSITQYLWSWIPYQRFSGTVSSGGLNTVNAVLTDQVNSIV